MSLRAWHFLVPRSWTRVPGTVFRAWRLGSGVKGCLEVRVMVGVKVRAIVGEVDPSSVFMKDQHSELQNTCCSGKQDTKTTLKQNVPQQVAYVTTQL